MKKKRAKETKKPDTIAAVVERCNGYQSNPQNYLADVLGIRHVWRKPGDLDNFQGEPAIWWMQDDLLKACPRAMKDRKAIYVASGHSLGKDYIAGAIALWFLQSFRPSLVVLTGPTSRQVDDIMWKETKSHWDRKLINLGGKAYNQPRIEIEKDWYLVGFTTKDAKASADAGGSKFQGFKGKDNVCVIVTEAQAVEETIYDQIDAITTGANILVIFLGNPTRAKGRFAKGLREKEKNIVFNFSCLESPNYIEQKSVIPGLVSAGWIEKMGEKWNSDGEGTDPRWKGRVLGVVPEGALNTVFDEALFNIMRGRQGSLARYSDNRGVALDPAGDGVDDNVIMGGAGGEVLETDTKAQRPPSENAIKAVEMCKRIGGHFVVVDCDGMGQRDFAELRKLPDTYLQGIQIIPFYGSEPSDKVLIMPDGKKKKLYGNVRAEASFTAQERAKAGKAALDSRDVELKEDLEADESFEKKGVTWLIDKDDIRITLGRSPGKGDAYKMLQWVFAKNIRPTTTYQINERNRLPAYGITDDNPPSQNSRQNLPAYGTTE